MLATDRVFSCVLGANRRGQRACRNATSAILSWPLCRYASPVRLVPLYYAACTGATYFVRVVPCSVPSHGTSRLFNEATLPTFTLVAVGSHLSWKYRHNSSLTPIVLFLIMNGERNRDTSKKMQVPPFDVGAGTGYRSIRNEEINKHAAVAEMMA